MSIVKQLVQRADSWVNAMTGLGTLRDKLTHAQVVPGAKLEDHTLEALFNDDDVARRVVAKLPREATRRGFRIVLEGDDEGGADEAQAADVEREMLDAFQKLDAMPKLRDSWIWARLYGGGGIFVGADDGRSVDQPLNEAGIRTVSFLNVLKRPQLTIKQRYEDVTAPRFGEPEIYSVNQAAVALAPRTGLDIHESRLILFDGAMTARLTMDSPTGFDDSVLQAAMASLQQNATAWQSVAHLLTDASQGVLKIANLVELVAADGQETLRARVQLMDMARSVCRSILIDAEKESFERIATSFAGLPEVMDRLMMRMSSAADGMPVTLLFGRSPAGLNATGESDIRSWYDTVAEGQTDEFKPRLERLLRLMFMAKDSPTRGRVPENWCIEFNPLWQPTDKELADTKKVKADTYVALVGAQIMTDAEAGLGLAPDFPTIDVESRAELAAADADEGLRPREVNAPPPPEPANDNGEPGGGDDAEGGSNGTGPKGRTDAEQPRVPAGSSAGGQFASSGGGGSGGGAGGGAGGWVKTAGEGFAVDEYTHPSGAKKVKIKTRTGRTKEWQLVMPDGTVHSLGKRPTIQSSAKVFAQASLAHEQSIKAQLTAVKTKLASLETGPAKAGKALGAATGGALADVPGREAVRAAMPGVDKATKWREAAEAELRQNPDNLAAYKVTARGLAADAVKVNAGKAASEAALNWSDKWATEGTAEHATAMANEVHAALRTPGSWAQAHYAATQAIIETHVLPRLRAEGKVDADGNVTLYRGVYGEQARAVYEAAQQGGGAVDLQVNKLSSWSESADVARTFGTVIEAKVHYSKAFITHHAQGRTWSDEQEWAVLSDGVEKAKVYGR